MVLKRELCQSWDDFLLLGLLALLDPRRVRREVTLSVILPSSTFLVDHFLKSLIFSGYLPKGMAHFSF